MKAARVGWTAIAVLVLVVAGVAAWLVWANLRGDRTDPARADAAMAGDRATVARGAYLARAGNCAGCHTERGGAPYAGGRAIDTPFGAVYATNLTADPQHGLGAWTADDFWRALHNGRSRDGRLLYPVFPYTHTTQVDRTDSDAVFAYLRTAQAVPQPNRPHALRWPYGTQAALAVWRALYFNPGVYQADPGQSAEWNRGAYLVQGLAHCSACHAPRNALGATGDLMDFSGGLIPMQNWYAPALNAASEAGVRHWDTARVVQLLKTGRTEGATVLGPMAEVVLHSTQYLSTEDLRAMAAFLKSLPEAPRPEPRVAIAPSADVVRRGVALYERHCAGCHGAQGEGVPNAYPPLAGNRAVMLPVTANLVQLVLAGGFAPATEGNPRPFGMPPYATVLSDAEVAAVLTHIRGAWGNQAAPVSELAVSQQRGSGLR